MSKVHASPGVIYALKDPTTKRIRYIGKSSEVQRRYRNHLSAFHRNKSPRRRVNRWLSKLAREGLKPPLIILQECLPGMLDACEIEWIAKGRAKGWNLCNHKDGGEGGEWDEEAKQRQSELGKAKWQDPEYRKRWESAHPFGRTCKVKTPEQKQMEADERAGNLLIHHRNMELHAARVAETQDRKTWVFVPLTRKGAAFLPLTRGKWAIIDASDWGRIAAHKWSAQHKGRYWRAKRNGPQDSKQNASIILLAREVMRAKAGTMVTHAEGNQLDCRRSKLVQVHGEGGSPMHLVQHRIIARTAPDRMGWAWHRHGGDNVAQATQWHILTTCSRHRGCPYGSF